MLWRIFIIAALCIQPLLAGSGPAVGHRALDFKLKSFDGETVTLSQYRGKVVLLNFWASWCPPCKEELPLVDELQKTYGPYGLVVLAVNIDNHASNARKFLKEQDIDLTPLWDAEKRVVGVYDVDTMPTLLMIDQEGWIRYIHSGFKVEDLPVYKREIESLLRINRKNVKGDRASQ